MNSDCFIWKSVDLLGDSLLKTTQKLPVFFGPENRPAKTAWPSKSPGDLWRQRPLRQSFPWPVAPPQRLVGGDARGGTKHAPGRQVEVCEGSSFFF